MIRSVPSAVRIITASLDLYRPVPEDNPLSAAKIVLGRRCSTNGGYRERDCSRARAATTLQAFTDGRQLAHGMDGLLGTRNAPTLVNAAWGTSFFWDGRATTLEQQALQPVLNPRELAMTPDAVVALIRSIEYRPAFVAAFGSSQRSSTSAVHWRHTYARLKLAMLRTIGSLRGTVAH